MVFAGNLLWIDFARSGLPPKAHLILGPLPCEKSEVRSAMTALNALPPTLSLNSSIFHDSSERLKPQNGCAV
jgi:hypothetical protein